jgi:hypothetical protein
MGNVKRAAKASVMRLEAAQMNRQGYTNEAIAAKLGVDGPQAKTPDVTTHNTLLMNGANPSVLADLLRYQELQNGK